MTDVASAGIGPAAEARADWWYKDGGAAKGPATVAELARLLGIGLLRRDALVWTEGYGEHWRRLDEAGLDLGTGATAPPNDYGRWTKVFARMEADPKARPGSWLGFLFGPLAYFWFGMWTKGLVILAAWLAFLLLMVLGASAAGRSLAAVPWFPFAIYSAHKLKRDYYLFRVTGERVWPRLRRLDNVWVCAAACVALFLAVGFAELANPVDALSSDLAGVWERDGVQVVVDTAGRQKTVTWDGVRHPLELQSVDGVNDTIVFVDTLDRGTLITLWKHTEDDGRYSLNLWIDDQLIGRFTYLRPV